MNEKLKKMDDERVELEEKRNNIQKRLRQLEKETKDAEAEFIYKLIGKVYKEKDNPTRMFMIIGIDNWYSSPMFNTIEFDPNLALAEDEYLNDRYLVLSSRGGGLWYKFDNPEEYMNMYYDEITWEEFIAAVNDFLKNTVPSAAKQEKAEWYAKTAKERLL